MQQKIKDKNRRFKELMACMEEEDNIHKKGKYKEEKKGGKESSSGAKRSCV